MIAHTSLPVSHYKRSKDFYSKILKPLGYVQKLEFDETAGFTEGKATDFWIGTNEGEEKSHVSFLAKSKENVDEFYKAAIAAGGKDNGPPGYRPEYWPGYYAAFIRDPDGYNIEAVFYDYEKK